MVIFQILTACNNDLFVERVPEVEAEIYLDSNKDPHTIKINKKYLRFIEVGDNYGYQWQPFSTYYDETGNEIANPKSLDKVAKIRYASKVFAFQLYIKEDEIEIEALDNTHSEPVEAWICLDYGYMPKYISLTIGEGKPYEIKDFGLDINRYSYKTETKTGFRETFHNNSDQTVKFIIYPYKDWQSNLTLIPDYEELWSAGALGVVSIPYFKDGKWTEYETEQIEAKLDSTISFYSSMVDINEEVYVEAPPHSSITVSKKMTYAILETIS